MSATKTKGYAPSMKRIYQLHKAFTKISNTQGTKYGEYGIIVVPRNELSKYEPSLNITKTYVSTIISFLEENDLVLRVPEDDKGPARLDVRQFLKLESLTKIVDVVAEKNEVARQEYHNKKEAGRSHMKKAVVVNQEAKAVEAPKEEAVTQQTELVVAEVKPDAIQVSQEGPTFSDVQETIQDGVGHLTETTKELVSYLTSLSTQLPYADPGLVAGLRQDKEVAENKARRLELDNKETNELNEKLTEKVRQNDKVITELNKRVTELEDKDKKHIAAERAQASNLEKATSDLKEAQGVITKLQAELKAAEEKAGASVNEELLEEIQMNADGLRQDVNNLCQLAPWQFSKSRHQYQNSMKRQLDSICRTLGIDVK
ncbi:hypothetical protein_gp295 [Bacillus phage vB_BceM_WH1]|nr:hypothetical protein_gp295 [Bacillus phage vB_BceM_WH1]